MADVTETWIKDKHSFLFSFESNGRLQQPMKYKV